MSPSHCHHLFVYGTLMTKASGVSLGNRERQALRAASITLGPATSPGRLYDAGHYPLLVDTQSIGDVVHGEVLRLDAPYSLFAILDPYEGFDPDRPDVGEYRRQLRPVTLADGTPHEAWVYVYIGSTAGRRRISDGRWPVRT
jgi:gamma-glutamylcyclotransferase (GGCT)/AIG2-like uncharacterized protein YtfP